MTSFGRELRRGTLELILLRLLSEGERYGYELLAELDRRSRGRLDIKQGTLYPLLYRLEDQGLVTPTWREQRRGVPRKYYRLTRSGAARLEELETEWREFHEAVDQILERARAGSRKGEGGADATTEEEP